MIRGIGKDGTIFVGLAADDVGHVLTGEPLLSSSISTGGANVIMFFAATNDALFALLKKNGLNVTMATEEAKP